MHAKLFRRAEVLFWLCIGMAISGLAWKTRIGSFHEPGPGFVAFFAGLFMVGVSLVMALPLAKSQKEESFDLRAEFRGISWFRLACTVALLFGYALVVNTLGYLIATFLLMWGLFSSGETRRWRFGILASLITTVASYLVFEIWLHCQLPRGFLAW